MVFIGVNLDQIDKMAPRRVKSAPVAIGGSWRGKMETGISLIVDWENGIYSLGLGFSHWEWDGQL